MALSVREQVIEEVIAALAASGTPASKVTRSQLNQIQPSDLPCYDVTPGDEQVSEHGEFTDRDSVTRILSVDVRALINAANEGAANGVPDVVLDDSGLDPFYVFAVAALTGNGENLGGVAISIEERQTKTVLQPGGQAIVGLEMTFEVTFATKRGNATQRG